MRLRFPAEPHADESFVGYILRLTELYRAPTPSWILQKARIDRHLSHSSSFTFNNSLDLLPLATLTGVGEDKLKALTYHPADGVRKKMGEYLFFGWPIFQYMIRPHRLLKICPQCLRESGYIRRVWELALVTTCPKHKCLLLDTCPNCDCLIPRVRASVSVCRCEFDWRELRPSAIGDFELEVTRRIHLLCNLPVGRHALDESRSNNPLYKLGLKSFIAALTFVASQFADMARKKGQPAVDTKGKTFGRTKGIGEVHASLNRAYSVFEDWPSGYFSFLDERQLSNGGDYFVKYKSALFMQLASPDLEFMRSKFIEYRRTRRYERYIASSNNITNIDAEVRKDGAASPVEDEATSNRMQQGIVASKLHETHVSGIEAIHALKVSWQGLEGLIAAGSVKVIIGKKGEGRVFLVEKASLEDL